VTDEACTAFHSMDIGNETFNHSMLTDSDQQDQPNPQQKSTTSFTYSFLTYGISFLT